MNSYVPTNYWRMISIILVASIVLVGTINVGLNTVNFELPWIASPFSVAGIFGLFYFIFDHFVWKWCLLRRLHIVTIPDLSGTWNGEIESSHNPDGQPLQVSVVISQHWSKILVELETEESYSKSIAASFLTNYPLSSELMYAYLNEPKPKAQKSMEMHKGTARLAFTGQVLEGDYYTGRGRATIGSIRLTRKIPSNNQ